MIVELPAFQLRIRFSFAAVITVMLLFCKQQVVLMSLMSSLIHESGHLVLMLFYGDRINYIELGLFGMRIEKEGTVLSYKKEGLIAMGGILLNLLCAVACVIGYLISEKESFAVFAVVNGFIALLNMLPVSVLDFGRYLTSLLNERFGEEKAGRITDIISRLFTLAFTLICIIYCILIGLNISFVAVTLYLNIITFKKKWS